MRLLPLPAAIFVSAYYTEFLKAELSTCLMHPHWSLTQPWRGAMLARRNLDFLSTGERGADTAGTSRACTFTQVKVTVAPFLGLHNLLPPLRGCCPNEEERVVRHALASLIIAGALANGRTSCR